jgi:hypothetical protein
VDATVVVEVMVFVVARQLQAEERGAVAVALRHWGGLVPWAAVSRMALSLLVVAAQVEAVIVVVVVPPTKVEVVVLRVG